MICECQTSALDGVVNAATAHGASSSMSGAVFAAPPLPRHLPASQRRTALVRNLFSSKVFAVALIEARERGPSERARKDPGSPDWTRTPDNDASLGRGPDTVSKDSKGVENFACQLN